MKSNTHHPWSRFALGVAALMVMAGCDRLSGTYVLSPVDPKATAEAGGVADKALAGAAKALRHCFVFQGDLVEYSRRGGALQRLCHEEVEQASPPQNVLRVFDCASGQSVWEFKQDMSGQYTHELELELPLVGTQVQRSELYPDSEGWCE